MPKVEFVGQSRRDSDSPQVDPSRLVNLYREPSTSDRTTAVLKSVLGTSAFAETSNVFMRAMTEIGGVIYAAVGGKLYSVTSSGTATDLGTITDATDTTIEGNNGNVCVAAGGDYYVWNGTTLSSPTTGAITNIGSVEFIGQRTLLTEKDGRRIQWSSVADPATFGALDFSTTESTDDDNIRAVVINGNLWIFKEEHIEIWTLTGGTDFIAPLTGATLDIGLKAHRLASKFPDGAFFVGSDGVAYITSGSGLIPVSTTAVETAISQGNPSQAFYYEDEGHKFCVIRFSDRPAWCYDLSTKEWHERAQGVTHKPWPAVETVKAWGNWYIGTDLGDVYLLSRTNADASEPLLRRAVSRTLESGDARLAELEIFAEMGEGSLQRGVPQIITYNGQIVVDSNGIPISAGTVTMEVDVYCWIRVSKDHGRIWGDEKWRSLGSLGEYRTTAKWRALGVSRKTGCFNVEFNMSDPIDRPIYSVADVRLA